MNALKVIPKEKLWQNYMETGAGKSIDGQLAKGYGTMKSSIEKKVSC
jgi:hypothetical protein